MAAVDILVGDVRDRLKELADESVHCIVTSPPYFGLRDYGCAGQIGLEATPDEYVAEMVAVFREARRVLRADGTFWLNLGDSYNSGASGGLSGSTISGGQRNQANSNRASARGMVSGLAAKQRLMIPARVALALQADGWWLRDEIIWHKTRCMPSPTKDRTVYAHEMIYTFAKQKDYYYNSEAIKEPCSPNSHGSPNINKGNKSESLNQQNGGKLGKWTSEDKSKGRNKRSVWSIATASFKGAHFATFPPDLVRPCILAGCPECGTVLDPFFGAGTTGLVARELGRSAIGIELNPEYAAIACERLGLSLPIDFATAASRLAAIQARINSKLAAA